MFNGLTNSKHKDVPESERHSQEHEGQTKSKHCHPRVRGTVRRMKVKQRASTVTVIYNKVRGTVRSMKVKQRASTVTVIYNKVRGTVKSMKVKQRSKHRHCYLQ